MDATLLSLDIELVHNVRRQTLNGREYVVADVIMLKEGVLNGSKGPLYYPPEEIAKRPGIWNGFPLTANHPSDKFGNPISARSPQAWQQFTIGHVFNDSYNPTTTERRAEAWFDVEVTNKVNPKIIPAVLSGQKINVSTGLFTNDEVIDNAKSYKGKEYKHIARNYQPDHLAVLLNDQGACSVKDGCGININSESHMRKDLVMFLVTNCECWKGKEAVLNDDKSFSDSDLQALKDNAEAGTLAVNTLKKIGTELKIDPNTTLALLPEAVSKAVTNAKTMPKETELNDEEKAKKKKEDATAMNKDQVTNVVKEYLAGLNEKERIDLIASPTVNALIKTGESLVQEKKIELIKALTANVKDDETKKAQILKLNKKSLDELKELHELVSNAVVPDAKSEDDKILANYFGANNGGIDRNKPTYNRNDVLLPSVTSNNDDEETVFE